MMVKRVTALFWILFCCCCLTRSACAISVVVGNGFELHASMTSESVNWIMLTDNVTLDLRTCPFPSSPAFPATMLDRNMTITSLSPEAVAAAAAAGVPVDQDIAAGAAAAAAQGPFWIDCANLNGRFEITTGHTLVLSSVVLLNCRTTSTAGFVSKQQGSILVLNNTVDQQSSVCLPLEMAKGDAVQRSKPQQVSNPAEQGTAVAAAGSNWCGAAARVKSSALPLQPLLANHSSYSICQQSALLIANATWTETPVPYALRNSPQPQEQEPTFNVVATQYAVLCAEPVPLESIQANGTEHCLAEAFRAVNPDEHPPCPALDSASFFECLNTPSYTRIVVLSDIKLNATTFPPALSESPPVITRNIMLESDPRGPRMVLDCALLTDRFQVPAGVHVTTQHIVLANCTIGAEKPLSFLRFSQGAMLTINNTYVLQPNNLCLSHQEQTSQVAHEPRPTAIPGRQVVRVGQASGWCASNPNTRAAVVAALQSSSATDGDGVPSADSVDIVGKVSPSDNSSYSKLPPIPLEYANRTGLGPTTAATLDQPARTPFFTHPTWPRYELCKRPVLLLWDYAYSDRFGWTLPPEVTLPAALAAYPVPTMANSSNITYHLPPELQQRLGSGYNSSILVHYVESALICQEPSASCRNQPSAGIKSPCLLAEYAKLDPDAAAGAVESSSGGGRDYGVSVILPAVLGSVGGALLLASLACCVLAAKRRHRRGSSVSHVGSKASGRTAWLLPSSLMGALLGTPTTTSTRSSADSARQLVPSSGAATASSPGSSQPRSNGSTPYSHGGRQVVSHEDIRLNVLIGAGSFGRVYSGLWKLRPVAVKVISHSSEDATRISRELSLSMGLEHPNLVRTLHFARLKLDTPASPQSGAPGSLVGSSLFLPEGAVGVFDLPSSWAVVQSQQSTSTSAVDSETWIVMELMNGGTLAAAVRVGAFQLPDTGIHAAKLLRRCVDVAAGVACLHARNVCHGDLKCDNVLLRTDSQDPDGMTAAVADFGLSRALAFGQSHLSTRRYGTVTHMPPELLVAGKLTPAADIYSLGVMMWEMVSGEAPFAGLHHGEVIHRVVTEDLRPGPWPRDRMHELPTSFIPLAEACWARQARQRPAATQVLQQLVEMLAQAEGRRG